MRSKTVSRLHPGAMEHYAHPEAYEARYSGRSEDVEYYLRKCRGASRVLEYGAGAGRLTIPLAKNGSKVVGVDTSEPMLALLRRRLSEEPSPIRALVRTQLGDMRTLVLRAKFDVIVAGFHTLGHLYSRDDMVSFLRRARAHLEPGGRLEFDLPLPRLDAAGYDPIAQVNVTEMAGPKGPELLTLRAYQPQEMAMFLHYAGFRNVQLRADFTRAQIDAETSVFTVSAVHKGLPDRLGPSC